MMPKPLFTSEKTIMFIDELNKIIKVLEQLDIPMPEDSQDFLTHALNDLFKKDFTQKENPKQISVNLVNQIRPYILGVN